MIPHRLLALASALAAVAALTPLGRAQSLTLESEISVPNGAEILSYSPDGDTVAANVTGTAPTIGVQLHTLNADATLTVREFVSVSTQFGGAILSVSSVALDPLGRGFGVMSVIPAANRTTPGVVVFFDHRAGSAAVIDTVTVGFHPDSLTFSRDGSKVFVANEAEYTGNGTGEGGGGGDTDAPGSVSVIDLSGINAVGDVLAAIDNSDVTTIDFSPANLAAGVDLDDLRYNDNTFTAGNAHRHVEPEYLTEGDGKLHVTLQENNAIAEISLTGPNTHKVTAIHPLGTLTQTIDASDEDGPSDGPAAEIDDLVKGMPMPDTIASFVSGGARFLVTANEGDHRPDDGDRARVKDYAGGENGFTYNGADSALGRLRLLTDVSDPDDDDLLNDIVTPGTRSFSIWNATTGALVADTGSFEALLLDLYPTIHNIDGETGTGAATFDSRSPNKGPEPEAITTGVINGHQYVFVGMERQGAILMFNVDDPASPVFVTSINNVLDGLLAPESLTFVSAENSPTGSATLLIGYEVGGEIGVYSVEGEAAIPPAPVLPTITVRPVIQTGAKSKLVVINGKASANTVRVTIGGKPARGTRNWVAKVPFPLNKKRLTLKAVAFSAEGLRATRTVKVVRRGR